MILLISLQETTWLAVLLSGTYLSGYLASTMRLCHLTAHGCSTLSLLPLLLSEDADGNNVVPHADHIVLHRVARLGALHACLGDTGSALIGQSGHLLQCRWHLDWRRLYNAEEMCGTARPRRHGPFCNKLVVQRQGCLLWLWSPRS